MQLFDMNFSLLQILSVNTKDYMVSIIILDFNYFELNKRIIGYYALKSKWNSL